MADRAPGHGRYAHLEREQRWIASTDAAGTPFARIVDRYVIGTRLRLRRAESDTGTTYKLAQKVRDDPRDPEIVRLTNIYLSEAEYDVVRQLPAHELHKVRSHVEWADRNVAIDRFGGHLDGLVLAEVELPDGDALLAAPTWAIADVTHDDRYSGGALAAASDDEIAALLRSARPRGGDS